MGNKSINRRNFIRKGGVAGMAALIGAQNLQSSPNSKKINALPQIEKGANEKIAIAFVGVGGRGRSHLNRIAKRDDVVIPAICDVDPKAIEKAQVLLGKNGKHKAKIYSENEFSFKELFTKEKIDGVIISTPWLWHVRVCLAALENRIFTGVEVSAANTIEECWDLVNYSEKYDTPCMILENVCYAREAMAVLNMTKKNVFGELLHATCGYRHDLRHVKFNGVEFGEKTEREAKWRTNHSIKRNGDIYPTHGVGPVAHWFDINRGNRFVSLTSTATKSVGLHNHILNHPEGGKDHPNAKIKWKLGDIITSVIKTANDETIIVTHDTNLPRPYSWGFTLQAAKGIWNGKFEGKKYYIEGQSKPHQWSESEEYKLLMEKYDHPLWKKFESNALNSGHGGIDYFIDNAFVEAIKRGEKPPIDVYDAAAWSAISPLSEMSVANNGAPQYFPDFTRGRWITNKKIFGLSEVY